jgi:hypothetical protein
VLVGAVVEMSYWWESFGLPWWVYPAVLAVLVEALVLPGAFRKKDIDYSEEPFKASLTHKNAAAWIITPILAVITGAAQIIKVVGPEQFLTSIWIGLLIVSSIAGLIWLNSLPYKHTDK